MRILGISAFYHDSAACLVEDGGIVAAAEEERFTRIKHDNSFPTNAVRSCLKIGGRTIDGIDYVVFYEKPFVKFERILETYLDQCPRGLRSYLKVIPLWIKDKLWMKQYIQDTLAYSGEILFADHHESHAAAAFYPSPFRSAAVLTVDGVGEWTTAAWGQGQESQLQLECELRFPHSLGLLYTAFTAYLGFKVNSDEYKVMGLAPYGQPRYADLIQEKLITIHPDGSFVLHMRHFDFETGFRMTSARFHELLGGPPRRPRERLNQRHKDLAASIQWITEEVILRMSRHVRQQTGEDYLCLGGGVALNCVANGRVLREAGFADLWIQPAAGDAGGALGAALAVYHRLAKGGRQTVDSVDGMRGALLGPSYSREEIRNTLSRLGLQYEELQQPELLERTARVLSSGSVVGWFQGRMEFGPRALGSRSILADPRHPTMQSLLNQRIKFRESFRPFAPSVLEERVGDYFELDRPSPYMLLVAPVVESKAAAIPAVTHVDRSARIQTVSPAENPRYHALLREFYGQTGCPVLINTSFNLRGEPIVCSPEDACNCFMRTNMDYLVIEDFWIGKDAQEWEFP